MGALSWFKIHVQRPSPLWAVSLWVGGPSGYQQASWASHKEQTSKQHSSMVSALTSLNGKLWSRYAKQYLSKQALLRYGAYHSMRKQTRTDSIWYPLSVSTGTHTHVLRYTHTYINNKSLPDMVIHSFNPSAHEAERGRTISGSLRPAWYKYRQLQTWQGYIGRTSLNKTKLTNKTL